MNDSHLEARIARLEAQNKRLKRNGLLALGSLGALSLMSFAAPALCEIVYAERFVLHDASNTKRITMNAYATDTPTISLHDARGKVTGTIGLNPEGAIEFKVMSEGKAMPAAFTFDDKGALRLAKMQTPKRTSGVSAKTLKKGGVN